MKDWDQAFVAQLLQAANYRAFIKLFFHRDEGIENPKKLTFGEFAQRSSFASKSYLNDIIAGRKRLTPGAFEKVVVGLKLNSAWAKYFKSLVSVEEPKFHSATKDRSYFVQQCQKAKNQLLRSQSVTVVPRHAAKIQQVLVRQDFPEIYAALGDLGAGETFAGILRKTRFSEEILKKALTALESVELLKFDSLTGRYVPQSIGLDAYGLQDSELFKMVFFHSLEKAKKRFAKQAPGKEALFMTQSFSVKATQLAEIRQRIAETMDALSAQSEDSSGDCIAELCISFTSNR